MEIAQLLIGLARMGYRGPIRERSLSSLVAWAKEYSVSEVLSWIEADSGLLLCASWQFLMPWQVARDRRIGRRDDYTIVLSKEDL